MHTESQDPCHTPRADLASDTGTSRTDPEFVRHYLYTLKPALFLLGFGLLGWGLLPLFDPALNPLSLQSLPPLLILAGILALHARTLWRERLLQANHATATARLELLELAQKHGCDLITLTDAQGRIRYISPSLERLSGYTLAEASGKNVNLFKSDANPAEIYRNLWTTLMSGHPWRGQLINKKASGERYYEDKRISAIKNVHGITTGYVSCGIDITTEHEATASLEQSEERFAHAMRSGHDAIWDWNLENNNVYFSPSWKAMLGYDEEELPHHLETWQQIVHADDGERVLDLARAYADRKKDDFETEFRMRHKDGRWRTFIAKVISAPGRSSPLTGTRRLIGTCVDITEMRRIEGEIRLLGRALAAVQNGVIISDATQPDMPTIYTNKAFTEITGYSRTDALEKNCRFLQGPDTDMGEIRKLRTAVENQQAVAVTLYNYCKDGRGFWNHLHLAPIFNDNGALTHYVGIMEDITTAREADLKLQQLNKALAHANLVKSQFMAKMSHELRTPMNGVLGMNQLLLETTLDDEQHEYAEIIETSGNDMLILIEEILTYANLDSRNRDLHHAPLPPDEVVRWVVQNKRRAAEAKGLQLNLLVDSDFSETCTCDPKKLHQALNYLVDNAIKFTQAGQIDLQVGHAAPGQVRIDVRDTGIGITPENLDSIFEAFHQGDNSHTRKFGGIGLGLTLCRALVEDMGGTVEVVSTPGQGSRFRIVLPVASDTPENGQELV